MGVFERVLVALLIAVFAFSGVTFIVYGTKNASAATGPQVDYRETGLNLPWFSNKFITEYHNEQGGLQTYTKSYLQNKLDESTNYHIRGTNCFRITAWLLEKGVSFEGASMHMTQNVVAADASVGGHGLFPLHHTIGTVANPFNGIFDGNGYTYYIVSDIKSNADNHTGLFGSIENAIIMNVTVSSDASEIAAFAGTNMPLVGAETQKRVGVIAANAKNSMIINCINKVDLGNLAGTPSKAAIVCQATEDTKIINCVDAKNFSGGLVNYINDDNNFVTSFNYSDWDKMDAKERNALISAMNQEMLYFIRNIIGENSGLYLWGIDSDNDDMPLFNAANAELHQALRFEYTLKEFVREMVVFSYNDNKNFIPRKNKKAKDAHQKLDERYAQFNAAWDALSIFNEDESIRNFSEFFMEASELMREAIYDFDDIYYDWADSSDISTLMMIIFIPFAVISLAAIVFLVISLRKKQKTIALHEIKEGKREKKASATADALAQILELQREKAEAIAQAQREKALALEKARREKEEAAFRANQEIQKLRQEREAEERQKLFDEQNNDNGKKKKK